MTVAEAIVKHVKSLPKSSQSEVLDFVEYLEKKTAINNKTEDNADWSSLSLSQAMRGMESEGSPYSTDDLKEVFT